MHLAVPPTNWYTSQTNIPQPSNNDSESSTDKNDYPEGYQVKFDLDSREMMFGNPSITPVHKGDWVDIVREDQLKIHCRVKDVSLYPVVKLSNPIYQVTTTAQSNDSRPTTPKTPSASPSRPEWRSAQMVIYNSNLDDMNDDAKAISIITLLETLPSVKEMTEYLLQQSQHSEPSLKTWYDRISPAALGILRWIIASNRSYIVQVDTYPGQEDAEPDDNSSRLDQCVSNIPDTWVQFRFAQGSPDKEQRFIKALEKEKLNIKKDYPTIFAFHGSPINNWHSIIRQGLDFRDVLHGRSCGDGIYHSQNMRVSEGYSREQMV